LSNETTSHSGGSILPGGFSPASGADAHGPRLLGRAWVCTRAHLPESSPRVASRCCVIFYTEDSLCPAVCTLEGALEAAHIFRTRERVSFAT